MVIIDIATLGVTAVVAATAVMMLLISALIVVWIIKGEL